MGLGLPQSEINRIKKCPQTAVTRSRVRRAIIKYLLDQQMLNPLGCNTAELAGQTASQQVNATWRRCFTYGEERNR